MKQIQRFGLPESTSRLKDRMIVDGIGILYLTAIPFTLFELAISSMTRALLRCLTLSSRKVSIWQRDCTRTIYRSINLAKQCFQFQQVKKMRIIDEIDILRFQTEELLYRLPRPEGVRVNYYKPLHFVRRVFSNFCSEPSLDTPVLIMTSDYEFDRSHTVRDCLQMALQNEPPYSLMFAINHLDKEKDRELIEHASKLFRVAEYIYRS